jgi:ABC-type antimicrobial peptide transport system permease subunit
LELFGITAGLFLGICVSKLITGVINILLKGYTRDMLTEGNSDLLFNRPDFCMMLPFTALALAIFIVYIVTLISNRLSLKKFNKLSPIEAIKGTFAMKFNKKAQTSNVIEKIFHIEGFIANKNIKRDKSKYKTIVISITINIILFLSLNGIISNYYKTGIYGSLFDYENDMPFDTFISFSDINDLEEVNGVIKYLEENELIDSWYLYQQNAQNERVKITKNDDIMKGTTLYLALFTDKYYEIETKLGTLSNIAKQSLQIDKMKNMLDCVKIQKKVTDILANTLTGLLALIASLNIFNTISSSIFLRKKDFVVLKSIRNEPQAN